MEGGYELPIYVKVIGAIFSVGAIFLIAAYEKIWELLKGLVRRVSFQQLAHLAAVRISRMPAVLKKSTKVYMARPHAL